MSEEEKSDFRAWLSASDDNRAIFYSVEKIWQATSTENLSMPRFNASKAHLRHLALLESEMKAADDNRNNNKVVRLTPWVKAIAAVFVLAVSALFVYNWTNAGEKYSATETARVDLSDGTDVWMSPGAILKFSPQNKARKATLSGKAYFDVQKDATKPFEIEAGGALIRVLGTQFIVDADRGYVSVREGKVQVIHDNKSVILTANQKVNISNSGLSQVSTEGFDKGDLWFNEDLVFNNSPFDQVIKDIEKAYGVTIVVPSGRDWSKCTFTSGSLKNNTIQQVLTTLKVTYDLEYTQSDARKYNISRVRCK